MNRSLLILVCDFLLVSMLSLANFDRPAVLDRHREARQIAADPASEAAARVDADVVAALQQSLADEEAHRQALAAALAAAEDESRRQAAALADTESRLAEASRRAAELAASGAELEAARNELDARLATTREELAIQRERLRRTEEELRAREETLTRTAEELREAAEARRALEIARQEAEAEIRIREAEKRILEQNLIAAQAEIELGREERIVLQRQTERLSAEVGRLAESSAAVEQTLRESTVVTANVIFDRFRRQRATLAFTGTSGTGGRTRNFSTPALLVDAGEGEIWALAHVADTPFALGNRAGGWNRVDGWLELGGGRHVISDVTFLVADPRLLAVRVPPSILATAGAEAVPLTSDPLRFPQAVLVSPGSNRYGELSFRIVPEQPRYLRLDNRLVTRLFGEFSPSRSDLVFTQGGELLGLMVNNTHAVQIPRFDAVSRLGLGAAYARGRSDGHLEALTRRVSSLPAELQ